MALVAAGAAGNLHDRIVRTNDGGSHGVVDFLKINYPWGGSWPTFNIADLLLLVGVGLLFFYLRAHEKAEADENDEDEADETDEGDADDDAEVAARDASA